MARPKDRANSSRPAGERGPLTRADPRAPGVLGETGPGLLEQGGPERCGVARMAGPGRTDRRRGRDMSTAGKDGPDGPGGKARPALGEGPATPTGRPEAAPGAGPENRPGGGKRGRIRPWTREEDRATGALAQAGPPSGTPASEKHGTQGRRRTGWSAPCRGMEIACTTPWAGMPGSERPRSEGDSTTKWTSTGAGCKTMVSISAVTFGIPAPPGFGGEACRSQALRMCGGLL
jgi:hypothetical protein